MIICVCDYYYYYRVVFNKQALQLNKTFLNKIIKLYIIKFANNGLSNFSSIDLTNCIIILLYECYSDGEHVHIIPI